MILSPYHNPPYRSPTPHATSSGNRSPKRKRDDDSHSNGSGPVPLELNTESQMAQFPPQGESDHASGASSPRTKVSQQLDQLRLQPADMRVAAARKRIKRNFQPSIKMKAFGGVGVVTETPERRHGFDVRGEGDELQKVAEVEETPGCHVRLTTSSSPPISPTGSNFVVKSDISKLESSDDKDGTDTLPSAPPPTLIKANELTTRSLSPLPLREELTPDQAALTWQEDEITGHDIDGPSGDDGEGINGIGFRPTPAIAYARQQRRKQQVNEWKAREAREARQRRIERRRGAVRIDELGGVGPDARRSVRFATEW